MRSYKSIIKSYSIEHKVKLDDEKSSLRTHFQNIITKRSHYNSEMSSSESNCEFEEEINFEATQCIPEIFKILWNKTTDYRKMYYLWAESFTIDQMNALWNSLELPFEYFKLIKLNKNITKNLKDQIELIEKGEDIYKYNSMISIMKNKDLDILLDLVLFGKDKSDINSEININEEYFCYLMKEKSYFNDLKSPLWLILSLKQKLLM